MRTELIVEATITPTLALEVLTRASPAESLAALGHLAKTFTDKELRAVHKAMPLALSALAESLQEFLDQVKASSLQEFLDE